MVKLAIVGEDDGAGGVGIEATDGLDVDVTKIVWQQGKHAWVLLRLVRGFGVGRFVEQDVEIGQIHGGDGVFIEFQHAAAIEMNLGFGFVHDVAIDFYPATFDPVLTLFATAQTLGL